MQLPNESLNVDNRSFLKIVCSILDIPVQENLVRRALSLDSEASSTKSTHQQQQHHDINGPNRCFCFKKNVSVSHFSSHIQVESLHVLFSLYLEFRDNPHFKSKLSEQRE